MQMVIVDVHASYAEAPMLSLQMLMLRSYGCLEVVEQVFYITALCLRVTTHQPI